MAKKPIRGSAKLHKRMSAFVVMFAIFVVSFEPLTSILLSVATTAFLSVV